MIELYIENKKIDLTEDLEINFTYESIDPDKLGSIKNSFSKTVSIPGTANNNRTFGHIFRNDKNFSNQMLEDNAPSIDNNFNPYKRVKWLLNKNGSLVNYGYCVLDGIVKEVNKVTYKLTLYGGIGEFFYSLNYTDDGEVKNLANLFFDWKPKLTTVGYGDAMPKGDEDVNIIYHCSPEIVAHSYHNLSPEYTYEGTTEIDKDIVFIPCYNGFYDNFDSKHQLVNTKITNIYDPSYIDNQKLVKLQNAFPTIKTDYSEDPSNPTNYTALNINMEASGNRYGLVNFSRDLDPSEAGELRVNEMPIAIRLSKLMTAISNPENNGGYTVEWDDDIKQSPYWKYSWLTLGKLKQDKNNVSLINISKNTEYDNQPFEFLYSMNTNTVSGIGSFNEYSYVLDTDDLNKGNYNLRYHIKPSFNFQMGVLAPLYQLRLISGGFETYNTNGIYLWNSLVRVTQVYDDDTVLRTQVDLMYVKSNELGSTYNFGYPTLNPYNYQGIVEKIKKSVASRLTSFYGFTIKPEDVIIHNCGYGVNSITNKYDHWPTSTDLEQYYTEIDAVCETQKIMVNFDLGNDTENLNVLVKDYVMWSMWEYDATHNYAYSGIWGVNTPSPVLLSLPSNQFSFFSNVPGKPFPWSVSVGATNNNHIMIKENLDSDYKNSVMSTRSAGYSVIDLTKKTLFADSASPLKYLSDFCKMMNYRIICDNTKQKVYIKTLKNYYVDDIVDINNNVDYGRQINIKNILTNDKILNFGLKTEETYPVMLFNKNNKEKFNFKKFDTKIEFNVNTKNVMDNYVYENSTDWQMSSVYYNNNPQFPKSYNVPSISWTLFNVDSTNAELKKKDFVTPGVINTTPNLQEGYDFLPKIAMFDKDNKNIDIKNTLVFLNGFVKNYDYNEIAGTTKTTITADYVDSSHYINTSGVTAQSQYQDIYIYNVVPGTRYFVTASFNSSYSSYVVNYFDDSDVYISSEFLQANANLNSQELTVPANAATIRCNFRKTDTSAKMESIGIYYIVSPKVMVTSDTYEQLYFNDSRCYLNSFNYSFGFVNWGCYDSDEQTSAGSWVMPFFSRDLYNIFNVSTNKWEAQTLNVASWNMIHQDNFDMFYNLSENTTTFVKSPSFNFQLRISSIANVQENEYNINSIPTDDETTRIYDVNWENHLDELYNVNTREITMYVDLTKFGDANSLLRKLYSYDGHLWIIRKIENYKPSNIINDRFAKVTLHKIIDKNNWVSN